MTTTGPTESFVERAARKREPVAYGLVAIGVVMLGLTIFWGIRWNSGRNQVTPQPKEIEAVQPDEPPPTPYTERSDYLPAAIWAGALAVLCIGAGFFYLTRKPPQGKEIYETRLLLITVGGCAGLLTAMLGFVFAWRWQDELVRWVNVGATGGAKWVVAALAIFLAGIVVMFFSVQLARAEERNDVNLRRVLYGSNAVLTGLLMLLLLTVVNIVVFLKLPDNMISTASAFKGLSDPSRDFLKTVNDDVKVYLVMPENLSVPISRTRRYSGLYADCRAMLDACQRQNNRIKVVPLSPVTDGDEIRQTMKRLKVPEEQVGEFGMLIGYGPGEEISAFISYQELFSITQEGALAFQGENRLMTELNFLGGGGQKPIVYFTQSNDEPALGDGGGKKVSLRTMRELAGHLQDRKYEVRPLVFERGKRPDLSQATMVVIVAPRIPFDQEQIDIFSDYLKGKPGTPGGKLVALLPPFPEVGGTNVSGTGLESLLGEYGIQVAAKRQLFSLPNNQFRSAGFVVGSNTPESRQLDHPLSRFLAENEALPFGNVRPVRANPAAVRSGVMVLDLFATRRGWRTYQDERVNSDADRIDEQIRSEIKATGTSATARDKVATSAPVPFAAYAAERVDDDGKVRERPRLLVIGTDWFASDDALRNTRIPQLYIAMMGTMLDYVREKPRGMYIEPRALGTYNLPKDPDGVSLLILPIGLVVLGILGLGVGVWVARRR